MFRSVFISGASLNINALAAEVSGILEKSGSGQQRAPVRVAVVVVNYNAGEYLEKCLSSIGRQDCDSYRVIIVDNHSSDDSAKDIELRHPGVQVIRLAENTGFAAGNNVGIAAAHDCEWIACLNPDAFPDPSWLSEMLHAAEQYPAFSFFGCKLLQAAYPDKLDGTGDIYHVSGSGWRRDHRKSVTEGRREGDEIFAPCAAAALYRRDAIIDVGGFDESFFCYFEDVDLAFRLRLRGHRCRYVPEAVVRHIGSAITGWQSGFTVYHGHRNLVWVYFKNMPAPLLWLYLPQHALFNVASLLTYTFRGMLKIIVKAKWDALRGLGHVLRERRRVQQARCVSAWEIRRIMTKGPLVPYFRRRS